MRGQDQLPLRRRGQRGVTLLDSLVALLVLAFGMLAMTRFQARLMAQGTEAQNRLTATRMADELLNLALVDTNARCYTVPAAGACTAPAARSTAAAWAAAVKTALPSAAEPTSTLDEASGRLTVVIAWSGKAAHEGAAVDTHQVTRVTDVR